MKNKDTDTVTVELTRAEVMLICDSLNSFVKTSDPVLGAFDAGRGILTRLEMIRHRLLDLFFDGR